MEGTRSTETLDGTVDRLDGTVDRLDGTVDRLDGTVDRLDGTVDRLDGTVDRLDGTVDRLDGTVDRLDGTVDRGRRDGQNVAGNGKYVEAFKNDHYKNYGHMTPMTKYDGVCGDGDGDGGNSGSGNDRDILPTCDDSEKNTKPKVTTVDPSNNNDYATGNSDHRIHTLSSSSGQGLTKYRLGLKHLIPIRWTHRPKDTLPLESLGFFSYATFGWLTPHLWAIYRHGLEAVSHLTITHTESAEYNAMRMEKFWIDELKAKGAERASFTSAIFKSFKTRFLIGSVVNLIGTGLTMANPIFVVHYFLSYLSDGDDSLRRGIHYVILLSLLLILPGLCRSFCWMVHIEASTRIKAGCHAMVYRKILQIKSLRDRNMGDLVNLFSLDGQSIWDGVTNSCLLFGGSVALIISCGYSIHFLGPWTLLAWVVILGFYPLVGSLAKCSMTYRSESIKISDKRVGLLTELLNAMSFIKMNAWEKPFGQKITDLRQQERKVLEKGVFIMSLSMGMAMLVPLFASCLTFVGYVASGHNLTATQAFTFLSLLNTMQISLATIPFGLKSLSDMFVSARRIKEVLMMEEMSVVNPKTSSPSVVLEMTNVCVTSLTVTTKEPTGGVIQSKNKKPKRGQKNSTVEEERLTRVEGNIGMAISTGPVLKDITFTLERGQVLGICGQVGCGKSTLLNTILGRMHVSSGVVSMVTSVAYVSQQPWVTSDTIRDNIVMGDAFDEDRYKQVIEACALQPDLDIMPMKDLSRVGEMGVTLSGGQQQRVALARAAYSKSDLVLLDDPLASVDIHVGQHIFDRCVKRWLKGRSVVCVTHQTQYLKQCDQILIMRDGRIVHKGSCEEIFSTGGHNINLLEEGRVRSSKTFGGMEFATLGKGDCTDVRNGDVTAGNNVTPHNMDSESDGLFQKESMVNSMEISVVQRYIQAMGGYGILGLVLLCFALPVTGVTSANWFLSYWINQGGGGVNMTHHNLTISSDRLTDHPNKDLYLTIYGCFLPTILFSMIIRALVTAKVGLRASTNIHNKGIKNLLTQPISFFHSTPVGRIINRFSTDLDELDNRLPMHMEIFLMNILQVILALAVISYVSPWFLLPLVPICAAFCLLVTVFHSCFHNLKSLDHLTRSPIVSHLTASIHGLHSIYAYDKTRQFFKRYCSLLDMNSVGVFLYHSTNRWLALRLDFIGALIVFFAGLFILTNFHLMNPAMAGLGVAYAMQVSGLLQFTIRLAMESEARLTSAQRLQEYGHMTTSNRTCDGTDDRILEESFQLLPQVSIGKKSAVPTKVVIRPSAEWPTDGHVTFTNVTLCYRRGLTPALRNVTFDVVAGQTVGIVGRTGAGKSSLCSALLRLFELNQGQISIDGLDISKVDCDTLRSRLSVIPQHPILLAGTLRYNLDPVGQQTDDALWEALEKCRARQLVKSLENQLDTIVEVNGDNFSIGEKQLLCMARVFLKKNRILILDEATASMDGETHGLVLDTVQEAFTNCTMLVISHRLDNVYNYDKILILDEGQVKEFDTPSNLLSNTNSSFTALFQATEVKVQSI